MKTLALLLAFSCATPCLAQDDWHNGMETISRPCCLLLQGVSAGVYYAQSSGTPPVSPHRAADDDRSFMPPDRREQLRQADPAVFHKMFPKADVTKPVTAR